MCVRMKARVRYTEIKWTGGAPLDKHPFLMSVLFLAVIMVLIWLIGPPKDRSLTGETCIQLTQRAFAGYRLSRAEEIDLKECDDAHDPDEYR